MSRGRRAELRLDFSSTCATVLRSLSRRGTWLSLVGARRSEMPAANGRPYPFEEISTKLGLLNAREAVIRGEQPPLPVSTQPSVRRTRVLAREVDDV